MRWLDGQASIDRLPLGLFGASTGGGAALFKRTAWEEASRFEGVATPDCWKRMAAKGFINGFIVPPIFVEHMDDPWSPFNSGKPGEIRKLNGRLTDEQMWEFHLAILREILDGPWDVRHYIGWRGRLRGHRNRLRRKLVKLGLLSHRPAEIDQTRTIFQNRNAAKTAAINH